MPDVRNDQLEKWEQAVKRLTDLTLQGTISWAELPTEFGFSRGADMKVRPPVFLADVEGKSVAVYEYEYKYYTDAEVWRPEVDIGICFADWENDTLRSQWIWPVTRARHLLWSAIGYQQSGAGDFLQQFLGQSMVG